MRSPRRLVDRRNPLIRPWASFSGPETYIVELYKLLERFGVDEMQLPSSQRSVLVDLHVNVGRYEWRTLPLLDFRRWDLTRLRERDARIAKPRIDVFLKMTRKGALNFEWRPTGAQFHPKEKIDFLDWGERFQSYDANAGEIFSLAEFSWITLRRTHTPVSRAVDALLVFATRAFAERVISFLEHICDVHVVNGFKFVLDGGQLVEWSIEDTASEWMASVRERCGISPEEFCALMREKDRYAVAKLLRARGMQINAKEVGALHSQFEHQAHRPEFRLEHPDLFPSTGQSPPGGQVIEFPSGRRATKEAKPAAPPLRHRSHALRDVGDGKSRRKPDEIDWLIDRIHQDRARVEERRHRSDLISLKSWFQSQFPGRQFDSKAIQAWAKSGRIQPAPIRFSNGLFVNRNAKVVEERDGN